MKPPGTLLAFAFALAAQETTLRTTVPLVTIPVSVTDRTGASIQGLEPADFVLMDEGTPRPVHVDVIESGLSPISLVTLVQTSSLSLAALAKLRKVGSMIPLAVLGQNGSAAVLTYDSAVKLVQNFTGDAGAISAAFSGLQPAGSVGGRMLDAVDQALNLLAQQPGGQRASILIIGENKDRGSSAKLDQIVEKIQRSGTTVYCLTYSKWLTPFTMKSADYQPADGGFLTGASELVRVAKKNTMRALTQVTGGQEFHFEVQSRLEDDLMRLSNDIHNRYLLSFTPEAGQTSSFRHIEIQIRNHPEAEVRARPGYWTVSREQ